MPAEPPISTQRPESISILGGESPEELRPQPSLPTVRPRRGVLRWLLALLVLTLAAGVTLLGVNDTQTHHRLRHTRLDLSTTQSSLRLVRGDLSATQSQLTSSQTQLGSTRKSLDETKKKLAADEQELQGLRNSLSDAKGRITVQSGQIETLKSCLNGVTIALSDAAYGDLAGAVSALQAVQVSCDAADKLLG